MLIWKKEGKIKFGFDFIRKAEKSQLTPLQLLPHERNISAFFSGSEDKECRARIGGMLNVLPILMGLDFQPFTTCYIVTFCKLNVEMLESYYSATQANG